MSEVTPISDSLAIIFPPRSRNSSLTAVPGTPPRKSLRCVNTRSPIRGAVRPGRARPHRTAGAGRARPGRRSAGGRLRRAAQVGHAAVELVEPAHLLGVDEVRDAPAEVLRGLDDESDGA